jgi:hypothetical protein
MSELSPPKFPKVLTPVSVRAYKSAMRGYDRQRIATGEATPAQVQVENEVIHTPKTARIVSFLPGFGSAERKRLLKRGVQRIEALARGKVKGLTEKQFRRTLRKQPRDPVAPKAETLPYELTIAAAKRRIAQA